jgi:hypothetical protein
VLGRRQQTWSQELVRYGRSGRCDRDVSVGSACCSTINLASELRLEN